MSGRFSLSLISAILLLVPTKTLASNKGTIVVPDLTKSPSFFELFHKNYSDDLNLRIMHEGRVRIWPLGTVMIDGFDWRRHSRTDRSFWQRMEDFRYLLSLMASTEERDKQFVRRWVIGWLDVHESDEEPNKGATNGMTVGIRCMIFVWYLKQLQNRGNKNDSLVERLRESIGWHQEYLTDYYYPTSNHAMWESMGLFETTRVHADSALTRLALDRLLEIVSLSVSEQGLHKEHSTAYHFYFLRWLSDYVGYLKSLDMSYWAGLPILVNHEKNMHKASYFCYDHDRRLPQIGDTDDLRLDDVYTFRRRRTRSAAIFDEDAGLAVFKDPPHSRYKRYIVYCIQKENPKLRFHYHDDAQAVYYSYDGEIILSDQGRYSYSIDRARRYFRSAVAHNIVFPATTVGGVRLCSYAKNTWCREDRQKVRFGSTMRDSSVTRVVDVPKGRGVFDVLDTIHGNEEYLAFWHIGPDVESIAEIDHGSVESGGWRRYAWRLTTRKRREFLLAIEVFGEGGSRDKPLIIKGLPNPMLGWYSSGYNVSLPATVIAMMINVAGRSQLRTSVAIER
ncbi:MAG: heparinase II/III family protein [Candidatus Latescibacterota bacterium]|nr:MAG: heparinase II/III family protein [Candidatus Latescibacterota bacterium]